MEFEITYFWLATIFGFLMAWGIGANDVSNAMGTSVGSKSITIFQAIIIATIFEFCGAFLAGSEVTNTIKHNLIDSSFISNEPRLLILGMLSSLLSAAIWLFIASIKGWPVSTTHTIVGAIIGFGAASFGIDAIQWNEVLSIIAAWILSPVMGAVVSFLLFFSVQYFIFNRSDPIESAKRTIPYYIFFATFIIGLMTLTRLSNVGISLTLNESLLYALLISTISMIIGKILIKRLKLDPKADVVFHFTNVEKIFGILMLFTACSMAFAHGSNDVANAIGPVAAIIGILSQSNDIAPSNEIPIWILLLGGSGIVVGLATYGHKVMATIGTGITQLTPSRGFSATLSASATVFFASMAGLPLSTTHTLVGGILGVGLARGIDALNLNVIRNIFMSWIVTLPAGAILSIVIFNILKLIL